VRLRDLCVSATLAGYLPTAGWPDAALALAVATTVRWPRQPRQPRQPSNPVRHEGRYFLSSLPACTRPMDLLALVRRHWHRENRLHWPRDVTFGDVTFGDVTVGDVTVGDVTVGADACQGRSGHAPQALAGVRNAVLGLLRRRQVGNLAAALRATAWSGPSAVLELLGLKL
jgi:hypothetical protein